MHKRDIARRIVIERLIPFAADVRTILGYSAAILKKNIKNLSFSVFLKTLGFPLGLSVIYITRATLDKGILAGNLKVFIQMSFLGLFAFVAIQTIQYFSKKIMLEARTLFSVEVSSDMTDRIFGLDYLKIKKMSSAENRFTLGYDQHVVEGLIFSDLSSLFTVIKVPVFFVLSAMISVPLTMIILLAFPFMAIHAMWFSKRIKKYKARQLYYARKHDSVLIDMLLNVKMVKSFFKENWATARITSLNREKAEKTKEYSLFTNKSIFMSNFAVRINTVLFWILGGYLVIRGHLTFGSFMAVSMYSALIISEVHNIGSVFQDLNEERSAISRSADFIRKISVLPEKPQGSVMYPDFGKDIEFREASFSYEKDRLVLEDVFLTAPAGKWTLIKGVSGCGKTTLLGLLVRLFPPDEGSVFIGEDSISLIDRGIFAKNISVVHQESYLLNDTLINNILLGDERTQDCIKRAIMCAKLDELVENMPLGYNNRVGESGCDLSGGQRQRIAIARALARETKVLILDEATSYLDLAMEKEIFSNIKENFPSTTVIVVTHRDTARQYADEVLVLENGKIFKEEKFSIS